MNNNTATIRMTKQDLTKAKYVLAQRNEKTRLNGFEAQWCDPAFRDYYHPGSPTGRQIYASYSGNELLDFLITYMEHHGHSPDWEKIHHVYKLYLSWRFGDLAKAKAKARSRQKAMTQPTGRSASVQNRFTGGWTNATNHIRKKIRNLSRHSVQMHGKAACPRTCPRRSAGI